MGRRHYGSVGHGLGASSKVGRTLIRQIVVCLIIVLLVIIIKKMDYAITDRALETIQTHMSRDYSDQKIVDSAKSVFSHVSQFPTSLRTAMEVGEKQMEFIRPSDQPASVMTFGLKNESKKWCYHGEKEFQVYASAGGTIVSVFDESGTYAVTINHGSEVESQYEGCSKVYVNSLERVKKGQLIASVAPGEESCLTFSLWKGQEAVNPADYIAF